MSLHVLRCLGELGCLVDLPRDSAASLEVAGAHVSCSRLERKGIILYVNNMNVYIHMNIYILSYNI